MNDGTSLLALLRSPGMRNALSRMLARYPKEPSKLIVGTIEGQQERVDAVTTACLQALGY